jgi:hypothetical protein
LGNILRNGKFDGEFISLENFANNRVKKSTLDIKLNFLTSQNLVLKLKLSTFLEVVNMSKKFMKGGHTIP